MLEGVNRTLRSKPGDHRTKLGRDRPGGNTDLQVPRDPTMSLLLSWPSGPSLMEGGGRKVFLLRKRGKKRSQ